MVDLSSFQDKIKKPFGESWLYAGLMMLLLACLFIGLSIAWAFVLIWALNIIGLHVAYGASEVLAVMILSSLVSVRFK